MYFGYNTNGLAHHRLSAAITLLAELGYRGVAITVDHASLDPFANGHTAEVAAVAAQLADCQMNSVIETGARYLLDRKRKHYPTLLSRDDLDRQKRIDFLKSCIDIAKQLGSDCVSLWSGIAEPDSDDAANWVRLVEGLKEVLNHAEGCGVVLGFEPEPGMFVDTMQRFEELSAQLPHPAFQLTLDLGHLHCQGEVPIPDYIARFQDRIVNIHIEDMRRGEHQHLMFGDGEMEFAPIMEMLKRVDYAHGVFVELSRHSHIGPQVAANSIEFLSRFP